MTYNELGIVQEWFFTNGFSRQLVTTTAAINLSTASTNLPATIIPEFLRACYIILVNIVSMNASILTAKVIKFLPTSVKNKQTNNMQQPFK
jgi:hypothetical protein